MNGLSGPQKAVLFFLGLDKAVAQGLLSQMADPEIKLLAENFDKLDPSSMNALSDVYTEFMSELSTPRVSWKSGGDYLQSLIVDAVGEQRAQRILPGRRSSSLHQLPAPVLADLLSREHPQAIAAVIYDLEDGFAAQVLKLLPKESIVEVIRRVAQLESVPREAIKEVEEVLLSSLGAPNPVNEVATGVAKAAALLNGLDGDSAGEMLTQIAAADPRLADAVRDARFTMEDLGSADDRGLQQLLREVENQKLLLALKTASESLRDKFLGCVSTRVAESIRGELATMGPVRLRDVEAAQREIVEVALRLQKDGKLMLAGQSGDPLV